MNLDRTALAALLGALVLTGCQSGTDVPTTTQERESASAGDAHAQVQARAETSPALEAPISDWEALLPEDARQLRPPPVIGRSSFGPPRVPGGLIDDSGSGTPPNVVIDHSSPLRAQQFGSSSVVEEMEGRKVALDGFVVPLESDDDGRVKELLFVSFYGACIHVPPPPPNQIIHVVLATPIDVPELWEPFHLSGTLHIAKFDADVASASYEVQAAELVEVSG